MIEVLPAPANVAAFHLTGTVTGDDFDEIVAVIEGKLAEHPAIGIYVDAIGWSDMTGEAIQKRIQYGISKLGDLGRFRRAGIVTDKEWIGAVIGFAGGLLPQLEARTFREQERETGKRWVAEIPAT